MTVARVNFGAEAPRPVDAPAEPAGQRKRGATLENAILAAAWDELTEAGYTSFSVEAVAVRARTGKASIYRRWPSKQLLLLDALEHGLPTPLQCGLGLDVPDHVTTAEALGEIARAISGLLDSPAGDAMRSIKCEAAVDPELAQAVDVRFQAPRRVAMIELLERGVARGEVRPGAVSPLVADVLPAVLFHHIVLRREPLTETDICQIVDEILLPLIEVR